MLRISRYFSFLLKAPIFPIVLILLHPLFIVSCSHQTPFKYPSSTMTTIDRYSPRDGDAVLPLFSLKGRTAIVSGAGAGIGLAVADALAEAGANVVIWYNSNKRAVERAEAIGKKWGVKSKLDVPEFSLCLRRN